MANEIENLDSSNEDNSQEDTPDADALKQQSPPWLGGGGNTGIVVMESIDSRDIVLLVIAGYVAVMALVRMMNEHRDRVYLEVRAEVDQEKARQKAEKKAQQKKERREARDKEAQEKAA